MIKYQDLPLRAGSPSASSWGIWGEDDRLGALNQLTPDRVLAGVAAARSGELVSLSLGDAELDPPLFGRVAVRRTLIPLSAEASAFDEVLDDFNTQGGSQWDGFGHVTEPGSGSYNGFSPAEHGVDRWAKNGIAGRGLLIDLPRYWASAGHSAPDPFRRNVVSADDLIAALDDQQSQVIPGDILVVRTGWLTAYRNLDSAGRRAVAASPGESIGLGPIGAMSERLWDWQVATAVADNPSLEAWPPFGAEQAGGPGSLHRSLLCRLGIPIGELWDLDGLSERCRDRATYDFLCVSAPLTHANGTASPANAVAIL